MEIRWLGYNTFVIKGNKVKVVIDPTDENSKDLSNDDVVLTTSDSRFSFTPKGEHRVFSWPGEYETKGVIVHSIAVGTGANEKRLISMEVDGIRICNLGAIEEGLNEETINELGNVDVLIVPLTLKAKDALEIIEEVDPRLVVFSMYNFDGAKEELPPVASILKEVGKSGLEAEEKIVVKTKADLDAENTNYAYLSL